MLCLCASIKIVLLLLAPLAYANNRDDSTNYNDDNYENNNDSLSYSAISTACTNNQGHKGCNLCVQQTNATKSQGTAVSKLLHSYLKYEQIKVTEVFPMMWDYNNLTVLEDRYITITFYIVEALERFGKPVPGCCRIPLRNKNCSVDEELSGNMYFSLTLFRSTVVEHYGEIRQTLTIIDTGFAEDARWPQENLFVPSLSFGPPDIAENTMLTDIAPPVPRPPAVWLNYTRYEEAEKYSYVCIFDMPKDTVMRNKTTVSKYSVDSFLFNRGVFEMPGYYYDNDTIYHEYSPDYEVDCTSTSFNGTKIYNLTSNNINNDTFTCIVLWLTVNVSSNEVDVKCMPHNATYIIVLNEDDDETYQPEKSTHFLLVVTVSSVSGLVILIIIIILICRWRKKMDKMIEKTKELPINLTMAMKESVNEKQVGRNEEELIEEIVTALDEEERVRIYEAIENGKKAKEAQRKRIEKQENKNVFALTLQGNTNVSSAKGENNCSENAYTDKTMYDDSTFTSDTSPYDFVTVSKQVTVKTDDSGIGSGSSPFSDYGSDVANENFYSEVFDDAFDASDETSRKDSGIPSSPDDVTSFKPSSKITEVNPTSEVKVSVSKMHEENMASDTNLPPDIKGESLSDSGFSSSSSHQLKPPDYCREFEKVETLEFSKIEPQLDQLVGSCNEQKQECNFDISNAKDRLKCGVYSKSSEFASHQPISVDVMQAAATTRYDRERCGVYSKTNEFCLGLSDNSVCSGEMNDVKLPPQDGSEGHGTQMTPEGVCSDKNTISLNNKLNLNNNKHSATVIFDGYLPKEAFSISPATIS